MIGKKAILCYFIFIINVICYSIPKTHIFYEESQIYKNRIGPLLDEMLLNSTKKINNIEASSKCRWRRECASRGSSFWSYSSCTSSCRCSTYGDLTCGSVANGVDVNYSTNGCIRYADCGCEPIDNTCTN